MRLYSGSSSAFIELNLNNQLTELLRQEFLSGYGYYPSSNEVMSWRNSLLRLALVLKEKQLLNQGIFVEYQLPLSAKRIDVIVCGKDSNRQSQAVIIELKQWERCELSELDSDRVMTWVGGGNRDVLHPSVQVGNYQYYLKDNNSAFYGDYAISLSACSYLHNYHFSENDPLFDSRFESIVTEFPIFTADQSVDLGKFLLKRLDEGGGEEILNRIEKSKIRPSKKLLANVSSNIKQKLFGELRVFGNLKNDEDYILLDEQLIVYDSVMSIVRKGLLDKQKFSIIVKGGAGTGKSVLALQLLADLAALGRYVHLATGSKSFTSTLRKILGTRSNSLIQYFMAYGEVLSNTLDVLIMDEAHRIREKTGYPFKSTGRLQVEDLIRATKVSVFFIDDFQGVRKGEIGSSKMIRENAERLGCKVYEFELEAQFRCGGSDGFTNWIDNTLHIKRTANVLWKNEENFEFKIFKSPDDLEAAIREKVSQGFSGRLAAGFCWPWSNELNEDGQLINDVQIGGFHRPWNANEKVKGLPKDIPKSQFWAFDQNGIHQIGCVYTAQGFEFDYAGIIFGNDLKYNPETNEWNGFPKNSHDSQVKSSQDFISLVKNTYRVLLTRGMRGCYVYFMDQETERFFRSRLE